MRCPPSEERLVEGSVHQRTIVKSGGRVQCCVMLRTSLVIGAATALLAAAPADASYTASITGTTSTLTGDTASDALVVTSSGGLLQHSALGGTFNSDFDWNSSTGGDQTLSSSDPAVSIVVKAGDGADTLSVGD